MKGKSKIRDLMVHIAWAKHALVFILRCHLGHVLLLLKKVDENHLKREKIQLTTPPNWILVHTEAVLHVVLLGIIPS